MPKLKTKKGVRKRVKVTATGRIKRTKAYRGHLKSSKNRKRKRILRRSDMVAKSQEKMIKHLLPYR